MKYNFNYEGKPVEILITFTTVCWKKIYISKDKPQVIEKHSVSQASVSLISPSDLTQNSYSRNAQCQDCAKS